MSCRRLWYPEQSKRRAVAVLALALLHIKAGPRRAAANTGHDIGQLSQPAAHRAVLIGTLVASGSLGTAGWLAASSDDLRKVHAGLAVGGAGLALAPLLAHGAVGEWRRGAWFSLPPALTAAGMVGYLHASPEAPLRGRRKTHSTALFPALVGATVVGSAVGVVDAALVDERRRTALHVSAHVWPGFMGVQVRRTW
jgi:hypothetical protein